MKKINISLSLGFAGFAILRLSERLFGIVLTDFVSGFITGLTIVFLLHGIYIGLNEFAKYRKSRQK